LRPHGQFAIVAGDGKGLFSFSRRDALPRNGDGCKAEGAGNGGSIAKPDNAADAPLRGNPKGRGDSGPGAALLAPDVE